MHGFCSIRTGQEVNQRIAMSQRLASAATCKLYTKLNQRRGHPNLGFKFNHYSSAKSPTAACRPANSEAVAAAFTRGIVKPDDAFTRSLRHVEFLAH